MMIEVNIEHWFYYNSC